NIAAGSSFTTSNITGAFSLTKTGTGTLTLTGANPYTGNTAVSTGEMSLAVGGSMATSSITVSAGAVFNNAGSLPGLQQVIITDASTNGQPPGSMPVGSRAFLGNNNPAIKVFAGAPPGGPLTIPSDISFTGSAGTAGIYAAGSGAVPGTLDLNG